MTEDESEKMASVVVDVIRKALDHRIAPLEAEVQALKAAHAALAEKALTGGAAWQRGRLYAKNDCVQYDGSLWRCVEAHVSGATFSHEHFVLQVKHGRDGKDVR
jgi:Carbohydrate-binding module family 5/12